jgi:hypothetical protein
MDLVKASVEDTALELVALMEEMEVTAVWASTITVARKTELTSANLITLGLISSERKRDTKVLEVLVARMVSTTEDMAVVSHGSLLLELLSLPTPRFSQKEEMVKST